MPQNWRLKVYLVLSATLISIYVLIPSFFGFNVIREEAEKKGASVPWYVTLFPSKALNLGLDLRGGIYVELEVSVEEAIHNRLDLMASELTRYLKDQKVEGMAIDRIPQTNRIRALVPDASATEKLKEHVQDYYRGALVEARTSTELTFQSGEKDENKLQALYNDLVKSLTEKNVEVERSGGSDLFRLVLKQGAEAQAVRSLVSSQFGGLKEILLSN